MSAVEPDLSPDCKNPDLEGVTVHDDAPFDTESRYWREKVRVTRYVGNHPEGVPLPKLARDVTGDPDLETDGTDPRYQRIRRFIRENPDFFEVEKLSGTLTAYPQFECLSLIFRGIIQSRTESGYTPGSEFAEDLLRSVRPTDNGNWNWSDDERHYLEQAFRDYLSRINDLRIILEADRPDVNPEYLTLPYRTRFNSRDRINKQWSILNRMIEQAGEWYEKAVFVTLTTKPTHFDNLYESIAEINSNWNRFMSWIQADSRLGYRPQYVKVLEFQESGNPHLHAIVFLEDEDRDRRPYLVDKNALDSYWSKWQGGYVNDIQPLIYDDDLGEAYDHDQGWIRWRKDGNHGGLIDEPGAVEDEQQSPLTEKSREGSAGAHQSGQTAGQYLGKYLSKVYGGILQVGTEEADPDAGGAYEDTADTWKLAVYWATGRKIKTASRDLRQAVEIEDDEESQLMDMIRECRYKFVGAWRTPDLPLHIYRKAVDFEDLMEPDPGPAVTQDRQLSDKPPPTKEDLITLEDRIRDAGLLGLSNRKQQ